MFTCLRVAAIARTVVLASMAKRIEKPGDLRAFLCSMVLPRRRCRLSAQHRLVMHIFVVIFPAAVADVNPIQVRIEASYDNSVYFPISPDVIEAKLLGGVVYFIQKAYGVFPYVRVRSVLATPASAPMTVHYSGHASRSRGVFETLDRLCCDSARKHNPRPLFFLLLVLAAPAQQSVVFRTVFKASPHHASIGADSKHRPRPSLPGLLPHGGALCV
ncbi:MAG: hypothetical protein IPK75_20210 [Acidobacteria bacterium]|nr:hypothetical protein [Acidobacteriota bacterium]